MKNFFAGLPYELCEAAYIDGASDFQILLHVYLPLSFSALATLSLFYAVGRWNSFSDALYYITSRDLQPLQLKLYNIIKGSQAIEVAVMEGSANDLASSLSESIESATIIFATLPILTRKPGREETAHNHKKGVTPTMKKILTLVLVLCMCIGLFPANTAAADDWLTLRVEMYDSSIAGFNVEDCWQLHYIQENFGDPNHIKIGWLPGSFSSMASLTLAMAWSSTASPLAGSSSPPRPIISARTGWKS